MNTFYEKNNIAKCSGKILEEPKFSHYILGEGFYELTLAVPRLSDEEDLIPVTVSERLIENIEAGEMIEVDGEFRSYNKYIDGKSKLVLTLFAKNLKKTDNANGINEISLTGFLCKPSVFRTTPFGREICDLLLAVNRSYSKSDYIPCIAWGRNARFVNGLNVGDKVTLEGRIQSRNYTKKLDDDKIVTKTAYEISISAIALAGETNTLETTTAPTQMSFRPHLS